MRDNAFKALLLILAIGIAAIAAYFSVFGLSKLFAGAATAIIIMASTLEVGKIVAATFLKKYWNSLSNWLKTYLMIAVFVLMTITSIGIYGFLSSAYQHTSTNVTIADKQANILETKKTIYIADIEQYKNQINSFEKRISIISGVRSDQEQRLNNQYQSYAYGAAKRIQSTLSNSDKSLDKLYDDIKLINNKIAICNDSITKWDLQILEIKNNDYTAELGPLIFLNKLTGISMDAIVNILILLFILVFDPLAIMFVVSLNHVTFLDNKVKAKSIPKPEKSKVDEVFKQYNKKKSRYKPKAQRIAEEQSKQVNIPGATNVLK